MLDQISKAHSTRNVQTVVGELVAFIESGGKNAMVIKRYVDQSPDGAYVQGELMTITQGKIADETISARRNTIDTFKNPQSRHYKKPGAMFVFENVKIFENKRSADGSVTAEASFINDIHNGNSDQQEVRSFLFGLIKPLPISKKSKSNAAAIEYIEPSKKHVVSTANQFVSSLLQAWTHSVYMMKGFGLESTAKTAVVLSDYHNSKPITIIIPTIEDTLNGDTIYRLPNLQEFKDFLEKNDTVNSVIELLTKDQGKSQVNVIPALRILVPPAKAAESKYARTIDGYTAIFKIGSEEKASDTQAIGYRKSVVALWNNMVSRICPLEQSFPHLNESESTLAIRKDNAVNRESAAKNRDSAIASADDAAALFDDQVSTGAVSSVQSTAQGDSKIPHDNVQVSTAHPKPIQSRSNNSGIDPESIEDHGEAFSFNEFDEYEKLQNAAYDEQSKQQNSPAEFWPETKPLSMSAS